MEIKEVENIYCIEGTFTSGDRANLTIDGVADLPKVFRKGRRLTPLDPRRIFFTRTAAEAKKIFKEVLSGFYVDGDARSGVLRLIETPALGYLQELTLLAHCNGKYEKKVLRVSRRNLLSIRRHILSVHGEQRTALAAAIDARFHGLMWTEAPHYDERPRTCTPPIATQGDLLKALPKVIAAQERAIRRIIESHAALQCSSFSWPDALRRQGFTQDKLTAPLEYGAVPTLGPLAHLAKRVKGNRALQEVLQNGIVSEEDEAQLFLLYKEGEDGRQRSLDAELAMTLHHLSAIVRQELSPHSQVRLLALKKLLSSDNSELCQLKRGIVGIRNDWLRRISAGVLRKAEAISLYAGIPDGICWGSGPVAQLYDTSLPYVDFTGFTLPGDEHEGD
jgi:hypothetical protein